MLMLTLNFSVFAVASRSFDWLSNLQRHVDVERIIRQQVMSEREPEEGDVQWGGLLEECKRELSCVCQKMAQRVGWRPGRPFRAHAPKPGEGRLKAMRTGRGGRHLFSSSEEDSEDELDAPRGSAPHRSDPWLAPIDHVVQEEGRDFVWGGYIDPRAREQPLPQAGIDLIERQVGDFHSERLNSPPKMNSLKYWAQASLRYPIVAQVARKYLCVPASSATSERSFSKVGHIVRARRAKLSDEHVKELSFLSWNPDLMY